LRLSKYCDVCAQVNYNLYKTVLSTYKINVPFEDRPNLQKVLVSEMSTALCYSISIFNIYSSFSFLLGPTENTKELGRGPGIEPNTLSTQRQCSAISDLLISQRDQSVNKKVCILVFCRTVFGYSLYTKYGYCITRSDITHLKITPMVSTSD